MRNKNMPKMRNPPPPPPLTDEGKDWQRYADVLKKELDTICYYVDKLQKHQNQILVFFSIYLVIDILETVITLFMRHNTP